MKPDAASGDPQERKRLLELVAFARRTPDRPGFTWRHRVFIGLAILSLFAALRGWTTWRSFHRPVEVHAEAGITEAEQSAMLAAIRVASPILDPVAMDAAAFQRVFLGRGRIERIVYFVRSGSETQATVYRSEGNRYGRWTGGWQFSFDGRGTLRGSSPRPRTIF